MRETARRLFENWWERAAEYARLAPVIAMLATALVLHTHGYHWE